MRRGCKTRWLWLIFTIPWLFDAGGESFAAGEKFAATITFCGKQTISLTDLRIVYEWRQMPLGIDGLVPYKDRRQIARGLWIVGAASPLPSLQFVPFQQLETIEFESGIQPIGLSLLHQFRVNRIWLKRRDGTRIACSSGLLTEDKPVLWPFHDQLIFPEDTVNQRLDGLVVSIQALTKMEGQDATYVFAFPTALATGIQPALKKQRDAFPRLIQFASGTEEPPR